METNYKDLRSYLTKTQGKKIYIYTHHMYIQNSLDYLYVN